MNTLPLTSAMPTGFKPPEWLVCFTPERIQRNSPCPCGSHRKYKHCCLRRLPEFRAQMNDLIGAYHLNTTRISFYLTPLDY